MPIEAENIANITIISGERGSGKTLLCILLKKAFRDMGKTVEGVISPGLYQNGRKIGILAEDISSGQRRQIASFSPGWDEHNPEKEWKFDFEEIEWINERLKTIPPSENLIIDEVGILELRENAGWTGALVKIDEGKYGHAYVVVRPVLLQIAENRWPRAKIFSVTSTDEPDIQLEKLLNQPNDNE